ncbi:MAG: cadherin-like domain-containing protein, partial [Campylobacterales bacterium]|nr:cadherin-like domain-containing protein [Campylobacterales bacterium]
MGFVIRWLRAFALFSFLSFTLSTQVFAFNVAQTTFVPLSEPNIDTSIKAIRSTGASNSVQTIISISATSNNTIIVYDQWEDGYESNLSNPVQTSTGVWGDGNTANGTAPGTTDDLIHAGDTITLRNVVNTASPATVDYDGSDKIGSTKAISVTQAGWDTGIGTIVAGAVNVIDAGNGGKNFILPIGENIGNLASNNATLFEYTSIHIIAYAANTNISIDKDGDGTTDQTLVLSEGQTARVDSGVINAGATVSSDKPIGVYLIAGDIGQSENRWFGLNSLDQWATSYYAPVATVGSGHPSHVFLRNPNASAITVYYDTKSSIGNTLTVNANATNAIQVPTSAVHFYTTDGSKFYAVGTIDSGASKHFYYDWSYSLVPESYLTDRFIVAWGPGSSNTPPAENGSPVWITSIADTWLYIDNSSTVNVRDSSGTAVTREVVDADTSRYRIHALESYRLYDTDYDQSGLIAYTLDGTLITAAWGEDPSTAGLTDPYLDMGTTVLPYPDYVFKKVSAEASPVLYAGASDGDLLSELNEEIEYTITIANRSVVELYNVNIKDALNPSDSATYVPSSATLTVLDADNNVKVNITDLDGASDTFPLSDPGYTLTDADSATGGDQGLARGHKIVVKYRMKIRGDINTALADDNYVINNTATMAGSPPVGDPIDPKDTNNTTIISVIDAADQSVVENVSILDANFTISNLTGLTQITVNGTDVSAAQLNASATTPVSIPTPQGTLTIKGFDSTTGVVTYDYDPAGTSKDHSGGSVTDPITLVASYSASVTVENMLNITILDTAPVANSDTNSIDENDANASGNVITGPTTADTLVGDSVSMTGIGAGTLPGVDGNVSSTVVGTYGSIIMQNNGDYVYLLDNANPSVNGLKNGEILSDIFTYTITDSDGNTSTTQLVVTINGVNDAPVAIDDNATTDLDTPVTIPVRNNDSDIEGDDLNVTVVSNGTNGTVSIDPISGDPVYTPNPGWTGIDTFTYTISDGNGTATATVTITVTSYPIDAVDDDYSSTPINGADGNSTASVLNNDTLNG